LFSRRSWTIICLF